MKNNIFLITIYVIITSGCSMLAVPVSNSVVSIPNQWHGYLAPSGVTDQDLFRNYYRIDAKNIYIKNISFEMDTGLPYVQSGNVYYVIQIKSNSSEHFQAIVKNAIQNDTNHYAILLSKKTDQIILTPPTIITTHNNFENIVTNNTLTSIYVHSDTNPSIETIQYPTINPDLDTRPFLTKLAGERGYSFWELTPVVEKINELEPFLGPVFNMRKGSRLIFFDECVKDKNGNPVYFKGSNAKVYGYAYRDNDPLDKPSYVLHYTPGPDHKYGTFWIRANPYFLLKNNFLPVMIVGDFIFSGVMKINVLDKDKDKAISSIDWNFFDKNISLLMQKNNMFIRSKNQPILDTMPKLPGS